MQADHPAYSLLPERPAPCNMPIDFAITQRSRWETQTAVLEQATATSRRTDASSVERPQIGPHNAVWYSGLSLEERQRVSQDAEFVTCAPQSAICVDGESGGHWLGVLSGLVAVTRVRRDGRPATLAGVPPGGWFGEGALLKREPYCYDARALRKTVIARLPFETFDWLLDRSISFNRYVMRQLNERLWQFLEGQEIDSLLDTDAKVARCLGLLFHPTLYPRNGFHLKITQQELADFCRLSRQRVNEALTRLEHRSWIRVEYGGIRVLDLASLQQRPMLARRGRGPR